MKSSFFLLLIFFLMGIVFMPVPKMHSVAKKSFAESTLSRQESVEKWKGLVKEDERFYVSEPPEKLFGNSFVNEEPGVGCREWVENISSLNKEWKNLPSAAQMFNICVAYNLGLLKNPPILMESVEVGMDSEKSDFLPKIKISEKQAGEASAWFDLYNRQRKIDGLPQLKRVDEGASFKVMQEIRYIQKEEVESMKEERQVAENKKNTLPPLPRGEIKIGEALPPYSLPIPE